MAAYGTDEGFAGWLAEQGYVLPASAPAPAVLRARASIYVDSYEPFWTGVRTDALEQDRAWPRTGATIGCTTAIPSDAIPSIVVGAVYRAAWLDASTPGILAGPVSTPGKRVRRNKVDGAVEREYFDDGKAQMGAGPAFIDSMIDGALRQFVCDVADGAFMWSLGA